MACETTHDEPTVRIWQPSRRQASALSRFHGVTTPTDMYLPAMTGLDLHRHLVASNRLIPTVLISARPEERVREQALQANIVCYLAKPFGAEELVACIRQAMQQPGIPKRAKNS